MFFVICQLNLPVLLAPTNYCFQDLVTPPSDRLWVVNQTFTKLDMVYSDFVVWPPDMVSVLILDSRKYGDNQIYLYPTLYDTKAIYVFRICFLVLWNPFMAVPLGHSDLLSFLPPQNK